MNNIEEKYLLFPQLLPESCLKSSAGTGSRFFVTQQGFGISLSDTA